MNKQEPLSNQTVILVTLIIACTILVIMGYENIVFGIMFLLFLIFMVGME